MFTRHLSEEEVAIIRKIMVSERNSPKPSQPKQCFSTVSSDS
jgi:hypothetical protein